MTAYREYQQQVEAIVRHYAPIWPSQRRALMGYMHRAGLPNTSAARSAFYAAVPSCNIPAGTRTNDLTYNQALDLIEALAHMDEAALVSTAARALKGQRA